MKQLVHRAIQIAESDPKGPVYLVAPREVLEEETQPISSRRSEWEPLSPSAIHPAMVPEIANDLLKAKKTAYHNYLFRKKSGSG